MTIASRTPEGEPFQCPICGKVDMLEPCYPGGDAVCPSCGQLLWKVRHHISDNAGVNADTIHFNTKFVEDLGLDSLEDVELIMELEEEFGVAIPDDEAAGFRTVADVIEYLRRRQDEMRRE